MSNTELLLKEIEGLPANYMGEILDFVSYLKHKAPKMDAPAGSRRIDPELAAIVEEAEKRAEREQTDPEYRAYISEQYRKCQEGGPIFGGMDGMEFQRRARDGWLD
ncbi:hypothetical protein FACS189494_11400 [Spirochaetia bacterium]|nr:hypothetical protein FACS189494_11400 [Spirochaetia bacterium]